MNEETTRDLPSKPSFEERVFARFDSVDARIERLEARSYDTKPIWEQALKAIMETKQELGEVKSKVLVIESNLMVIETDLAEVKTDLVEVKNDLGAVKTDIVEVKTDIAGMKTDSGRVRNELTDMRRELRHDIKDKLNLILKFLLEDREDIRDAEDKIRQLETKLA